MAGIYRSNIVVHCPLCLDKMTVQYLPPPDNTFIYWCPTDKVAIRTTDPLVNRWHTDGYEKIECPNCNADMRVFFNSTGYMKAKCPKKKCGCTVEGLNTDRKGDERKALKLDGVAV